MLFRSKRGLTSENESGIICEHAQKRAVKYTSNNPVFEGIKKVEKTFKKCLTNGNHCGIITRSREKRCDADL